MGILLRLARSAGFAAVLIFVGAGPSAGLSYYNFGINLEDLGGVGVVVPSGTPPSATSPSPAAFYGGDVSGFTISETASTTVLRITFNTSSLPAGSVITGFELFVDGLNLEPGGAGDNFSVQGCNGLSCPTGFQTLVNGGSGLFTTSAVPKAAPAFLGDHTASTNDLNRFVIASAASGSTDVTTFQDEILAGSFMIQLLRQTNQSSSADFIAGLNLQVEVAAAVPEPTSVLLFGTTLVGMGVAFVRRRRAGAKV